MNTLQLSKSKSTLTEVESSRLAELEPIIERGLTSFVEVGSALLEISNQRLYRATHSTFKDYVSEKWKMTAGRAYQLCEAAEVIKSLPPEKSTMVDNERKARALAKVPREKRAKVLEVAATNGPVTAKSIKEAAVPTTTGKLHCPDCDHAVEADDAQPRYECAECGEFTPEEGESNRCPDCNKFGSKSEDLACPGCGTELEERADVPEVEPPMARPHTPKQGVARGYQMLYQVDCHGLNRLRECRDTFKRDLTAGAFRTEDGLQEAIQLAHECERLAQAFLSDNKTVRTEAA